MKHSSQWREEACKRFPELLQRFDDREVDSPDELWVELSEAFHEAYEEPKNSDLIKRIYDYAWWCIDQPAPRNPKDDLATYATVGFLEHIPESDAALEDMPYWFTLEDVREMETVFSRWVGREGFEQILRMYEIEEE